MQVEQINDIPLICSELKALQITDLLNKHFAVHGNWQGVSLGTLGSVFLTYVLSESDHRLSRVEDWYSGLEQVLRYSLESPALGRLDCTDDRLGSLLDYLSDDARYASFEQDLNRHMVSVYRLVTEDIESKTVHLDATIAQSFKDPSDLFSIGYAKHRRKDLAQVKIMLSTVGRFGMPLCVDVVKGAAADDVLYLPMIERVEKTLETKGLLFVGDSKLGSIGNRSMIAQKGHYYLTPLSRTQLPYRALQELLIAAKSAETFCYLGDEQPIKTVEQRVVRQEQEHRWEERLIVAHSPTYAQTQRAQFEKKISQTTQHLEALTVVKKGKKPLKNEQELRQKISDILAKSKTAAFFEVSVQTTTRETLIRKYGAKPPEHRVKCTFELRIDLNRELIEAHKELLGWRVYATNAPVEALDTAHVLEAYRDEYKVEYRFNQLHHKTAALMPIYLQKDNRIKALIRLLMVGVKVMSIIQFKAREALKKTQTHIKNLFPGNPGRKTTQPTAEMILRAFRNISLVSILLKDNGRHRAVSKLSDSQVVLLELLGLKPSIYEDLPQFLNATAKISET